MKLFQNYVVNKSHLKLVKYKAFFKKLTVGSKIQQNQKLIKHSTAIVRGKEVHEASAKIVCQVFALCYTFQLMTNQYIAVFTLH